MKHPMLSFLLVVVALCGSYELYDYYKPVNYTNDKWVVFDFDGTIAAAVPAMITVINELQPIYGYAPVQEGELESLRQRTTRDLVDNRLELAWYQLPLFHYRFRKAAMKHLDAIQLNDGMHDVLTAVKTRGYKIGVLSSNSVEFIMGFFKKNNLPLFEDISESSIFGKAVAIKKFMRRNGIYVTNVVYVGDETRDIEAARDAQVSCIAVSWGGNCAELLQKYQPTELVHDAMGLQEAIQKQIA